MNNFNRTFLALLKELKAQVTKTSALEFLETHPDYHSMLAYSDALNKWNIQNLVARIEKNQLDEIPPPYIIYSKANGGTFNLIRKCDENTIESFDTTDGWRKNSREEFLLDWDGIVMMIEANAESGEIDYKRKRKDEILNSLRVPLALSILFCALSLVLLVYSGVEPVSYIFITSKLIFSSLSVLLLAKSLDAQNSLLNKFCNNGRHIRCQSILESGAAKITSWLSWSDIGFLYAVGSLITLLLSFHQIMIFQGFILGTLLLSLFGLAFSFYSLYYQGIKSKIWCPLCLAYIAMFWVELGLSSFSLNMTGVFSVGILLHTIPHFLIGFFLAIAFLMLYKREVQDGKKGKPYQRELEKLKLNPEVFKALLASQPQMPALSKNMGLMEIGNLDADNILTAVSNPLCSPCAKMHLRIEKILHESPNIKCKIIFLTSLDKKDIGNRFVRILLSLPSELKGRALNEWYSRNDRNFDDWYSSYLEFTENRFA